MRLSRAGTLRARLRALGLAERGDDVVAAAAAGLRDTRRHLPRRARRPAHGGVESSILPHGGEKRQVDELLVGVWGPRGAPYVVATADVGVFTRGGLPTTEVSEKAYAPSAVKALAPHGRTLLEAAAEVEAAMVAAVENGPVERDAMHEQLRQALPGELSGRARAAGRTTSTRRSGGRPARTGAWGGCWTPAAGR